MSVQHPTTIDEWAVYISGLHGMDLWITANTANSLEFVKILKGEGCSPEDITTIMSLFAEQFISDDMVPPQGMPGQYLSYSDLLASLREGL